MTTGGASRVLVVMRHAKAESVPSGPVGGDVGRRLTERGRADAAAAGRFLASVGVRPEHALVSSAERTQQTWAAVRDACAADATEELSRALYGADSEEILEAIRLVDDAVGTLVFVGHNPDTEVLGVQLADGSGSAEAESALAVGFATATLAVYDVPGRWADLDLGGATVRHVHTARA